MRTIGFFIHNDDIGIVQTPQHFFNNDPIQSNLYLSKVWPDEQRLFFDAMAPCRDSWNAAFMVKFIKTSSEQKYEIIAKLFTGKYNNQVAGVQHIYSVISQLFLRAFGKEMEHDFFEPNRKLVHLSQKNDAAGASVILGNYAVKQLSTTSKS